VTPTPRVALLAHGGAGLEALDGAQTLCLGAEREGLPDEVLAECEAEATIPLQAGAAESLNVAAAAAIAAQRISSPAMPANGAPDA
jgi:TrmH family RNA methyltransferase